MCEYERFWDKVVVEMVPGHHAPGPCWIWHGGISEGGRRRTGFNGKEYIRDNSQYGSFWYAGTTHRAHVWIAWAFGIIPELRVPEGMNLDHTCQNTLCVCPWHLELVPQVVNLDRIKNRAAPGITLAACAS